MDDVELWGLFFYSKKMAGNLNCWPPSSRALSWSCQKMRWLLNTPSSAWVRPSKNKIMVCCFGDGRVMIIKQIPENLYGKHTGPNELAVLPHLNWCLFWFWISHAAPWPWSQMHGLCLLFLLLTAVFIIVALCSGHLGWDRGDRKGGGGAFEFGGVWWSWEGLCCLKWCDYSVTRLSRVGLLFLLFCR